MPSIKIPKKPDDFEYKGQTWTAFMNNYDSNGALRSCAGRDCDFFRRGECWINDYGDRHCIWPYFWRRKDKEGNILDRDGWKLYDKDGKYIWTGPYGRLKLETT